MTDDGAHLLPKLLADVARASNIQTALRLADEFGGQRIYVPMAIKKDHDIARVIGVKAASALAEVHGGSWIIVPLGPNASAARVRRTIVKLLREGKSSQDVVRQLRCHSRTVWRVQAELEAEKQPDLFAPQRARRR